MHEMALNDLWRQCSAIAPELIIAATVCVVILVDMCAPQDKSRTWSGSAALAGTLCALLALFVRLYAGAQGYMLMTFGEMVRHDQLAVFFRFIFLLGTSIVILFSMRSRETEDYRHGEYFSLVLGALLGAMLIAISDNFILFILGFETLSICSYVLASFIKHERLSAEAGLKYMIYGAVASGIMMFGMSYLYGMTGTMSITEGVNLLAGQAATGQISHLPIFLILVLILVGIGFKMAMVPFHFWCPDVYQGSPTPVTAFLAVVSKAAGFSALLRVMIPFFLAAKFTTDQTSNYLPSIELPVFFGILSMVTMTYGNLVALRQTDVKRLLAYSSIAHAGYLLMGMTVYDYGSIEAIFFYFLTYLIMNLGAFWVAIVLINRLGGAEIARFRGVAFKAPFLFVAMFIFLISLTGLPPTAGFVGKFMLFKVVIGAGVGHLTAQGFLTPMALFYFLLAIIGLLNSAISLYYYMSIARTMVFEKSEDDTPLGDDLLDRCYAGVLAITTLVLLNFSPILVLIQWTAR
jgi:NADH-quinone oxidoreductase subunit N